MLDHGVNLPVMRFAGEHLVRHLPRLPSWDKLLD